MSDYDAVLFDMDGVTVASAGAWRALERETILPRVADGASVEDIRAMNVEDSYERLAGMDAVSLHVDRAAFVEVYDEYASEVYRQRATLMEGYESFITDLRARGLAVGLVSASGRRWVEMVLDRFDLQDRYDVVVSADDIDGPSKPDPTPYRTAADRLGVRPEDCLVVEDSVHGVEAATRAGTYCIALRGDANETADLSTADAVVESPAELREAVSALLG